MEEKRKNKRTDLDINVSLGIITEDVNKEKEYIDVEKNHWAYNYILDASE